MARSDLVSLTLYQLFASNRSGVLIVYFPIYLHTQQGAPVPLALTFASLGFVSASLLGPVAGRWSDRLGRRRPFLLAAEAGAIPVFIAIGFAPGYLVAGGLFIASQMVLSIGAPALSAYVSDLTRERERGRGYGTLAAASSSGAIIGYFATAVVVSEFGFRWMFPFIALVMMGTVAVVVFLVPDRAVAPSAARQPWRSHLPLISFSTLVSIRALGAGAVGTFFGVLAAELGASVYDISLVAIAGLLTGALLSVPLGRYVDRAGEIRAIWLGTLVTLGGIGIFLLATQWTELVPAQVLRNAGFALLSTGMLAYVANRAPADHRAEHLGVFSLINSTAWSLGPLAGGVALAAGGNPGLFLFAIATTVASLVAIEAVYLRRLRMPRAGT